MNLRGLWIHLLEGLKAWFESLWKQKMNVRVINILNGLKFLVCNKALTESICKWIHVTTICWKCRSWQHTNDLIVILQCDCSAWDQALLKAKKMEAQNLRTSHQINSIPIPHQHQKYKRTSVKRSNIGVDPRLLCIRFVLFSPCTSTLCSLCSGNIQRSMWEKRMTWLKPMPMSALLATGTMPACWDFYHMTQMLLCY